MATVQYRNKNVEIRIKHDGEYSIPETTSGEWSAVLDSETLRNIDPRVPELPGSLLRELNPHPAFGEVMYSENDINRTYFSEQCKQNEIAEKVLRGELPEGTGGIYHIGTLHNKQCQQNFVKVIDDEQQPAAPEQVPVTWDGDNKEVAFVKKMLSFIPYEISSNVMIFERADDVFKLEDEEIFTVKRIVNIIPVDILKKYGDSPLVVYLGNAEECDSFTLDTTAVGLQDFIKSEFTFRDMVDYAHLNWEELETLLKEIDEGIEQFETWVLDTFADIRMYDKNIDPFKLMELYDNIGTSYIQHNNGRDIFDSFVLANDFKHMQVNIDGDIYTGYYANHVLFIKDCSMNYLRVYIFDVLLTEDDIFENTYGDAGYKAIFVTDLDFSDNILDDIRECMFSMYEQAFIEYNTPCREETYEDDTSKDV